MIAEDILKQNQEQAYYNQTSDYRIKSMKEYAELKCQQLLEIVAEKVKQKTIVGGYGDPQNRNLIIVDKDSILNAVNLKEFIQ